MVQLFLLFTFGPAAILFLFRVRMHYARGRLMAETNPADARLWGEIASGLFASYDQELSAQDRMELALRSGLKRLRVGGGIVTLNGAHGCRVLATVTADDASSGWLSAGKEISLGLTYCGLLNEGRESLAIDFASLSDWRHHAAHRDLGWESFIGTRRELESGGYLAVGFYGWAARDQIFGAEEKLFVSQLANWITAISQSEGKIAAPDAAMPELAPAAVSNPISAQV